MRCGPIAALRGRCKRDAEWLGESPTRAAIDGYQGMQMKPLETTEPGPREDRFSTALLHDEPNCRIIGFHLLPGQSIPPHRNESTVTVFVTEGEGLFSGEGTEAVLSVGMSAVYAPGETHSIQALEGPLRFQALITPSPSSR